MNWLTGSVITLALTIIGAVWRLSALVSELKSLQRDIQKLEDKLEEVMNFKSEINRIKTKIALIMQRCGMEHTDEHILDTGTWTKAKKE